MKKIYSSIVTSFIVLASFSQGIVQPSFLMGGIGDAQKLFGAYITPWANMFGTSLSGGWYNSAKPHKLGGFDLTFTFNTAFAPMADKSFDVNSIGLTHLKLAAGQSTTSPTIAGKATSVGSKLDLVDNNGNIILNNAITLPKGSGLPFTFMPMAQVGIGLMKGTELNVRYSPPINYGKSGKMNLWGVGLKHSIFQYIPLNKAIPLDISLQGGYTKFQTQSDVSFKPDNFEYNTAASDLISKEAQKMQMNIGVWTVNLLISTTLPLFNVYGGVGYAGTNSSLAMNGYYPVPDPTKFNTGTQKFAISTNEVKKDPIDITINSKGSLRLNLGIRLKFALLTWQLDYTYAYYSMISTGLGLSFR